MQKTQFHWLSYCTLSTLSCFSDKDFEKKWIKCLTRQGQCLTVCLLFLTKLEIVEKSDVCMHTQILSMHKLQMTIQSMRFPEV